MAEHTKGGIAQRVELKVVKFERNQLKHKVRLRFSAVLAQVNVSGSWLICKYEVQE
jgi:hypothetical protein